MERMIKMVVFDMAGTTVDEQNVVYKTLHQVIVHSGLDISFQEVLRLGAGKEKKKAIQDILVEYGADLFDLEEVYLHFKSALHDAYLQLPIQAMSGAEELFAWLRQRAILVVLNTGYDTATANLLVSRLGWQQGSTFDLLVCADMVATSRPAPDMIQLAMQQFRLLNPAVVAKIGDSIVDIEEGLEAGCGLVLGITTGAHTNSQLLEANPNGVLHHLLELKTWI